MAYYVLTRLCLTMYYFFIVLSYMLHYLNLQEPSRLIQNRGCTESQIIFLSKRVVELTHHLREHPRDYSSTRGLKKILGQRKRLLSYLNAKDLWKYNQMVQFIKQIDA